MEYALKVKPDGPKELKVNPLGAGPGDASCVVQLSHSHPLQQSEENYGNHQFNIHMRMLRNHEGLHAPLKLSMELLSAKKVGRLPFLTSSNAQLDALLGKDELVEFPDFLGTQEYCEHMRQPHAVVEKFNGNL